MMRWRKWLFELTACGLQLAGHGAQWLVPCVTYRGLTLAGGSFRWTQRSEIKWFHYTDYDWSKAAHYLASGWKNNDVAASPALAQLYVTELQNPRYLHAGELQALKGWTP